MEKNNYEQFLSLHEIQLVLSGVPSHFWPKLHEKLKNEVKQYEKKIFFK